VVIDGAAAIVSVIARVPEALVLSVARNVTLAVTAAVGVPVIVPFADKVRPAGNVPEARDQV
jgi:hypothetical protein